jgi:hypothetical protein
MTKLLSLLWRCVPDARSARAIHAAGLPRIPLLANIYMNRLLCLGASDPLPKLALNRSGASDLDVCLLRFKPT